jgi:hypothetical protein
MERGEEKHDYRSDEGVRLNSRSHHPSIQAKIKGATIVASLSTIYFGVFISSLPQVIFSLGTAPE